ncbi:MAG: hypothetical protein ABFS03_00820 [Chloroflexota bacterium]
MTNYTDLRHQLNQLQALADKCDHDCENCKSKQANNNKPNEPRVTIIRKGTRKGGDEDKSRENK